MSKPHSGASPCRYVILEPRPAGHRLWYVSLLVRACESAGNEVRLITSLEARSSAEWTTHRLPNVAEVVEDRGLVHWHTKALRRVQADEQVIVPDGDSALFAWSVSRRRRVGAVLIMRPVAQGGLRAELRFAAKIAAAATAVLRHRGGLRLRYLRTGTGESGGLWRVVGARGVSDPVAFSPPARAADSWRAQLDLPAGGRVFLIAGAISERKHVSDVLQSFETASGSQDVLVLAGRMTDEPRAALSALHPSARARVRALDRYLDDQELDGLVATADVMILAYDNSGSSGLLLKSVVADVIVAVPEGSMLEVTARRLGARVAPITSHEGRYHLTWREHSTWRRSAPVERIGSPAEFAAGLLGTSVGPST